MSSRAKSRKGGARGDAKDEPTPTSSTSAASATTATNAATADAHDVDDAMDGAAASATGATDAREDASCATTIKKLTVLVTFAFRFLRFTICLNFIKLHSYLLFIASFRKLSSRWAPGYGD